MHTRRQFIQAGTAVIALAPTVAEFPTAPDGAARDIQAARYYKVVFEQTSTAASLFAEEARRLGALVEPISGNITDLWFNDLHHRWQAGPAAIAGMTSYRSMFGLQMMAQDVGMRLAYASVHAALPDGSYRYIPQGPGSATGAARLLCRANRAWPVAAARIVLRRDYAAAISGSPASVPDRAVAARTLVSWIIAPVRRA